MYLNICNDCGVFVNRVILVVDVPGTSQMAGTGNARMSTPLNGSVLKAFAILRLITPERPEISATTVASELGMNTATAHRFLLTLEETGALGSHRRGYFHLGLATAELGRMTELTNPLSARLQPLISTLAEEIRESVMVCRLGRLGPTCIAVAAADRPITVNISVGTVLPIAATAQGKIWLAYMGAGERETWCSDHEIPPEEELLRIRSQGFARNRGENEPDIAALAVPIMDENGKVALTLSTFGMLSRFDESFIAKSLPLLKANSAGIKL